MVASNALVKAESSQKASECRESDVVVGAAGNECGEKFLVLGQLLTAIARPQCSTYSEAKNSSYR